MLGDLQSRFCYLPTFTSEKSEVQWGYIWPIAIYHHEPGARFFTGMVSIRLMANNRENVLSLFTGYVICSRLPRSDDKAYTLGLLSH